jgi:integrase
LAGSQYYARRQALPNSEQRILQAIERLVEAKIPPQDYNWERVWAEAGVNSSKFYNKVVRAFGDGHETLTRYHEQQQQQRIPNATYTSIQGNLINVDEPAWYLAPLGETIRRDRLRSDIATIAWPMLREEALTPSTRAATLFAHHQGCRSVAKLFGDTIPDIHTLTLATLQQAWAHSEASIQTLQRARTMLVRMLETLITQNTADTARNVQEYALGLHWLQTIRLNETASDKTYLSEEEFDKVINCCLEDIMQGLAYMQHSGSAGGQVTADFHTQHPEPMFHWGIGIIILIMAFTGLRRQSITRLTTEDIAQIGPQVFALTWRHGKPNKQRTAIIPALVAEYLQQYIHATEPVRTHLSTQQIFFARNPLKRWAQMTVARLDYACGVFDSRHALARDGAPLRLGSTILRRTYVTRALYELPNIAALQAQLGHNDASTTLAYAQHEQFEHPDQVDGALDAFGRKVLARWYKPHLLNDLPDTERKALLADRIAHEQDVGMCRHNCCVKLSEDHLPPCSLCEHLVSGPEYLAAWEHEKVLREQQLERLAKTPGAELLLAQMKGQYDRFLANYRSVQERSHI